MDLLLLYCRFSVFPVVRFCFACFLFWATGCCQFPVHILGLELQAPRWSKSKLNAAGAGIFVIGRRATNKRCCSHICIQPTSTQLLPISRVHFLRAHTNGGADPLLAFEMLLVLKANSLRGWEPNIIQDYRRKKDNKLSNPTKLYKTLRATVTPFTIIWWPKECDVGRRRTYVGPIPYLLKPLPWSSSTFQPLHVVESAGFCMYITQGAL